jgi:hypothetical protein
MSDSDPKDSQQRAIAAYNRMMDRVKTALEGSGQDTLPKLREGIAKAVRSAEQLGELSRDEAEKIAAYLQRDLHDAGEYLAETGRDLRSWLRFDVELIEDRLWDLFSSVADRTRLEWLELAQRAEKGPSYSSGEITGPGTLRCSACQQDLHFHATAHIPPCPHCHGTNFIRPVDAMISGPPLPS